MLEQLSLAFKEPRARRRRDLDTPNGRWLEEARRVGKRICTENIVVTIDDIRRLCPLPEGLPLNLYGKVFQEHSFEPIGRIVSTRPEARGRTVLVFTLRYVAPRLDA
jgi:hypothetical protein